MSEISNPHDKFFKQVFSRMDTVQQFIRHYLPPDVVGLLDLETLEYTKDTFIDKQLKEYFSDLLLKVYLKDGLRSYVYILFEHKSYQEPLIAFHLLRYMVKIWEMLLKKGEGIRFPVIIPLVLYHGEKKWRTGLNFKDMFDSPEDMTIFIPDFGYLLWDSTQYSDEEIKGETVLRAALLILKHIFDEDLKERLPGILGLLRDLSEKRTGIEFIETILKYLLSAASADTINDYEEIKAAVDQALPQTGGEIMPTVADVLREEGRQQGLQQGLQQGILQNARKSLIDALDVRFETTPQSILKILDEISDPSILGLLHRKALKAKSLEDFRQIIDLMME
jgi:predicted transposase/invertase (TIGR01784 family)